MFRMKKEFFVLAFLLFSAPLVFSEGENIAPENNEVLQQETAASGENKILQAINESPYPEQIIEKHTKHGIDWFVNIEPLFVFRTVDPAVTNPAPLMAIFPFSIGLVFPEETPVSFQPKLTVFSVYYCWDGANAFPATQMESIATAFNFLLDFSVSYAWCINLHHHISAATGPAFLFRTACPMNGLYETSRSHESTVGDEVHKINTWFWLNANFLYWDFSASYLYEVKKGFKIGPEARFYLPLGSIFQGQGMNGFMIGFGAKAQF